MTKRDRNSSPELIEFLFSLLSFLYFSTVRGASGEVCFVDRVDGPIVAYWERYDEFSNRTASLWLWMENSCNADIDNTTPDLNLYVQVYL